MIGIYKITSPSGRVYIGQSWNIMHRFCTYRGSLCKQQPALHNSFKKYGASNHIFEIIQELPIDVAQEVLNAYEQLYMDAYRDCGIKLLNLKSGGSNGKHSEATKKKISAKSKGHPPTKTSFKKGHRLIRTEEWCSKISKSLTGKRVSEETKKKLSDINSGQRHPQFGKSQSPERKKKIGDANRGVRRTEEQKRNLAEVHTGNKYRLGKRHTEETKKKISETKKRRLLEWVG